jgi:hypothetical protein
MPSLATAFDIARLYDELRECVRANDQDGVKRVFSELVQARRPVSEILAEVKSLTKERESAESEAEKPETEAKTSFRREWAVSTPSSQMRSSTPTQAYRDAASASAPPTPPQYRSTAAAVEPPAIEKPAAPPAQPLWRRQPVEPTPSLVEPPPSAVEPPPSLAPSPQYPEPAPSLVEPTPSVPEPTPSVPEPTPNVASFSPQSATFPAPIPQEPVSPALLAPPEPTARSAETWPSHEVSLEVNRPVSQESAADPAFESPAPAATPVIEPAPIPVEASPVPSAPPAVTAPNQEPSGVDLREIIRSASGVAPSVAAERQPIRETVDQAAPPSTRPGPDYAAFDTPVSNRAASLGVALEAGQAAIETEPPARRIPVMAIAIALVAVAAIAGGGWFALSPRGTEQVALKTTPVNESAATASQEKSAQEKAPTAATMAPAPAPAKTAPAPAPAATAREHASAATPAPAPAPAASAQPLPAPPNAGKPEMPKEATPSVAKLETPKEPAPDNAPVPEVAAPTAQKPTASSEPRLTAAETAALLSRGDSLFSVGDVASARLYYERAAEAGNGDAALRLGETYDPTFLERAKLRAIKGDLKTAAFWYRRAKELGVAEADILLKGIQTK